MLGALKDGQIDDQPFHIKDRRIGVEFYKDGAPGRILSKTRELYPDSDEEIDTILVSDNQAFMEWTLRISVTQRFLLWVRFLQSGVEIGTSKPFWVSRLFVRQLSRPPRSDHQQHTHSRAHEISRPSDSAILTAPTKLGGDPLSAKM